MATATATVVATQIQREEISPQKLTRKACGVLASMSMSLKVWRVARPREWMWMQLQWLPHWWYRASGGWLDYDCYPSLFEVLHYHYHCLYHYHYHYLCFSWG